MFYSRYLVQKTASFRHVLLQRLCPITSHLAHHETNRLYSTEKGSRIIRSSAYHPDIPIPNDKSYVQFILEHCERHGEKEAIVDGLTGRSFTYNDVHVLSKKCGSALKRMGLNHKDVIALYMPNMPEYPMLFYGIQAAGGIATTVNPTYTADELAYQLKDASAKYLISSSPDLMAKARQAASKAGLPSDNVLDIESLWKDICSDDGSHLTHIHTTNTPSEDVISLPYSSGTTGLSKGVMITDTNLMAHALMLGNNMFMSKRPDIAQAAVLGLLPFFHAYGLAVIIGMHFYLGSKIVSLPKFDSELFLKTVEQFKITDLPIVPPIVLFLAKHPLVDKYDLSSVESIISAAAPVSKEVELSLWKRLPNVRILRQGYGLTETTAGCIINPSEFSLIKNGSVGILLPNQEAMIKDLETGEALGPGIDGEICVRAPTVTKGYLNNPEKTAQTIDQDGWLHTGDIGHYDEDEYFYVVDRRKELIKYKGYQVPPAELEAVLVSNPNIVDAAVVGVPDEQAGELPKAFVVIKGEITEEQVQEYVASKVSPHKRLRGGVEFVESIPKTPTGKILRRVLRDQTLSQK